MVSATATNDAVATINSYKKVDDKSKINHSQKGIMPISTGKRYWTYKGKKYWYRYATYHPKFGRIHTLYWTSFGAKGVLQFKHSSNGSWYRETSGTFWTSHTYKKLNVTLTDRQVIVALAFFNRNINFYRLKAKPPGP